MTIEIEDHGLPIPDDERLAMFEPFPPGSGARSAHGRCAGLGLYVASEIVKAHGGRIEVTSIDAATRVCVTLPRHGSVLRPVR
jgi:signal transduction histidine kinase